MGILDRRVRREWWRSLFDCLLHNPAALKIVLSFAALYLHFGPYSRDLLERLDREIDGAAMNGAAPLGLGRLQM